MSRSSTVRSAAVALITTVLSGLVAETASAQLPTNPEILQRVQALQSSVNSLQLTVNNLATQSSVNTLATQASVNALQSTTNSIALTVNALQTAVRAISAPDQSNVRFTPALFLGFGQSLLFGVINVGSVARTIKVELIRPNGSIRSIISEIVLEPNESTDGNVGDAPVQGTYYLKFTVLDGSRTDIRASAQQLLASNVVGAALAAE